MATVAATTGRRRVPEALPLASIQQVLQTYFQLLEPLDTTAGKEETFAFVRGVLSCLEGVEGKVAQDTWKDAAAVSYKRLYNKRFLTSHIAPSWYAMYLGTRDRLPFGWNYAYGLEKFPINGLWEKLQVSPQALTASIIGTASLHLRALLNNPKFGTPEVQNQMPKQCRIDLKICQDQLTRLFRTVRIPHKGMDSLRWTRRDNNKVLVLCKGNPFVVEWMRYNVTDAGAEFGKIHMNEIVANARRIDALLREASQLSQNRRSPLILAGGNRDVWARAFEELWSQEPSRSALADITSCAFGIALDSQSEFSQCLHGGVHPENRYPDMNVMFIVDPTGSGSCNVEHSWGDGTATALATSFIHYYCVSCEQASLHTVNMPKLPAEDLLLNIRAVNFGNNISSRILRNIEETRGVHLTMVKELRLVQRHVLTIGTKDIKKCKVSPDAFMHAALHVSQKRLFGRQRSTYASLSMRNYHHGRTEALRTVTKSTQALATAVESAQHKQAYSAEVAACLQMASREHTNLILKFRSGKGFHVAIRLMSKLHKEIKNRFLRRHVRDVPCNILRGMASTEKFLFSSPLIKELSSDYLSTSNVSVKGVSTFSFPPTHPDGLGIGYSLLPERISFTVSAFHSFGRPISEGHRCDKERVADAFADTLQRTMQDLYDLSRRAPQSKL